MRLFGYICLKCSLPITWRVLYYESFVESQEADLFSLSDIMKLARASWMALMLTTAVSALSAAEWRTQSIYQVFTDRFARTDNSTTATCNTGDGIYCGGSWRGIINKLDYIQNMGFTAVSGTFHNQR